MCYPMFVNTNNPISYGQIIVAPEVMMTVIRQAAQNVPDVASMTSPATSMFRRGQGREGIILGQSENGLKIDIHVVLKHNVNMIETAQAIQSAVSEAVDQIIGVSVSSVDVHIEDITFNNNDNA
jgi:uncharacterized alkaline shock family protein YloU